MTNYGIRAVGALFGLVLGTAACGPTASGGAHLEPELEKFVSPDVLAVAQIQLGKLRRTQFFRRHQPDLVSVLPGPDVDQLLLTWDGKEVLVAQLGHPEKSVKVSGDPATVSRAKNAAGRLSDELTMALTSVRATDQVWALVRGLPVEGIKLPSEYASLLANFRGHIRSTAIGLAIETGLNLRARIDCFSEQGAQRVDVALRAGIGLGRLSITNKNPLEARVYELLSVHRDGASVFVQGDFPPDVSDYLLQRALAAGHA